MFNVEFGLMQTLPRFGMRNVAPTPLGVSISAPDGTLPPDLTLAPLILIGLLP